MILPTFHSSLLYSWTVTATHTKNQEKKLEGKVLATEQISVTSWNLILRFCPKIAKIISIKMFIYENFRPSGKQN